jgi:hypothetical protein
MHTHFMNADTKNLGLSIFLAAVILCVGILICQSLVELFFRKEMVEGMDTASSNSDGAEDSTDTYQPYDTNSTSGTMILAQKNAGNIEVLKGRLADGKKMSARMSSAEQQIDLMQQQINGLVQQQSNYATDLAGGNEPLSVTGTSD